jgi:hypothetical protein
MKTILKLAVAAAVTYAAWNAATAWVNYWRFKDAVTQVSQYGAKLSPEQLQNRVAEIAAQYSIPLDENGLKIRRDDLNHTYIDGSYTQSIAVLPWYSYPYTFPIHIDTFTIDIAPIK